MFRMDAFDMASSERVFTFPECLGGVVVAELVKTLPNILSSKPEGKKIS
jgi:hypothetical protein